jgi:integrase
MIWEKAGWLSEGCTAALASRLRGERMMAKRGVEPEVKPPPAPTFGEAYAIAHERYFRHIVRSRDYASCFNAHLGPLAGKPLDQINARDIEILVESLAARAPATIAAIVAMVKRVYGLMAKWGVYGGPCPAKGVYIPKADNKRQRYLTPPEAAALMDDLKARRLPVWRIAMASLCTGMRRGEVLALRGDNVNLEAGTIAVVDTKTGRNRTAFIPPALRPALDGLDIAPGRPVFASLHLRSIERAFNGAVKRLGFNDGIEDRRNRVVFHTLRHTFASWLATQGESLYTIASLLGHATISMTQRYAHLMPEARRSAMAALDRMFNPGTPADRPSGPDGPA